jgi:hypothetical protein
MQFTIQNQTFEMANISRLYPAAMVSTGTEGEVTQISLEWVDTLKNEEVEVVKYAIFIHMTDNSVSSFFYEDREALDIALEDLALQIN